MTVQSPHAGVKPAAPAASRKKVLNVAPVPRLALTRDEAAAALGVSSDFLDDHIIPELRVIRRGKLVLVPVVEIEKWLAREAALTLTST